MKGDHDNWSRLEGVLEDFTLEDFKYGEDEYMVDEAVAYLLMQEVLFCNSRPYLSYDTLKGCNEDGDYPLCSDPEKPTVVIFVNCSDVCAWGCSDAEEIERSEVSELLKLYFQDNSWGVVKWVCKKRKQRPQFPIRKMMKEANVWEDWMDDLQENFDETEKYREICKELRKG